jgi:hypothetical protein
LLLEIQLNRKLKRSIASCGQNSPACVTTRFTDLVEQKRPTAMTTARRPVVPVCPSHWRVACWPLALPLMHAQAPVTPIKFQLDWRRFEGPSALFLTPVAGAAISSKLM